MSVLHRAKPEKSFIFCVHAHQPVGNFGSVFQQAYAQCYRPFFEVLAKHPKFLAVAHFSGSLLDWLEAQAPDFIEKVRAMACAGQIEILGGAYYEPIYGAIPARDLEGQIERMHAKVEALFGQRPSGVWLTERVWDSHVVGSLSRLGVEYTVLDDFHFERAGEVPVGGGYYRTQQGADEIDLFAASRQFRYQIPFQSPKNFLDTLSSSPGGSEVPWVFADDCEKFGLWPGTQEWVYGQKWLDRFFSMIEKSKEIRPRTFSQFRREQPPVSKVQIPHASYAEMMDWSGGNFYNFFDRYPESRYMQERMLSVSDTLLTWSQNHSGSLVSKAETALYQAQCNCAYWHGVFGGLHLHHLRSAVFENLIRSEQCMKNGDAQNLFARVELASGPRWKLGQRDLQSFFRPCYGGALEELDYIPRSVNLMCNLGRHRESYHDLLSPAAKDRHKKSVLPGSVSRIHQILGFKEKGLQKHLFYDRAQRLSFMDHFFEKEVSKEDFHTGAYLEAGDFVGSPYGAILQEQNTCLRLERSAPVRIGGKEFMFRLAKTVRAKGDQGLEVSYEITSLGRESIQCVFGVEFNFSIGLSGKQERQAEKPAQGVIFFDPWRQVEIELSADSKVAVLSAPVETVSESERGLQRNYQQLGVLLQKHFKWRPQETKRLTLSLGVTSKELTHVY